MFSIADKDCFTLCHRAYHGWSGLKAREIPGPTVAASPSAAVACTAALGLELPHAGNGGVRPPSSSSQSAQVLMGESIQYLSG